MGIDLVAVGSATGRAVLLGAGWGVVCGLGNGVIVLTTLVQMGAPWVAVAALGAYAAGGAGWRRAAVVGAGTLASANVAYVLVGGVLRGAAGQPVAGGLGFFLLWTVVGALVGPLAGVAGARLRDDRRAPFAIVALASVSAGEALALWLHLAHVDARATLVGVAALALGWGAVRGRRTGPGAGAVVLATAVLVFPVAIAIEVALIALGQVSAPMRLL